MIVTPRKINVAEDPKQKDFHITIHNESPVDDTNSILLFRIRRAQEKVLSFRPKKGLVLPGETKDVTLNMLTTNFHHSKLLVKAVIVPRNQVVQDFETSWNIGAAIGESKKLILLLGGLYDGLDERFMYGGSLNSGDSLISPSLLSINRSMSFSRDFSDISSVAGGGGGLPVDRVASPLRGAIMALNTADDEEEHNDSMNRYNNIIKQSTLQHTPRSMLLDRSFEQFSRLIPLSNTSSSKPPMLSLHIDGTSSANSSRVLNEESVLLALEGRLTQALLAVGGAKVGNIEMKNVDLSGPLAVFNTLGKAFARPEGMQYGSSTKDLVVSSNNSSTATELINSQLRALFLEDNLRSLALTHCNLNLLTNDNCTIGINRFHSLTALDLSHNQIAGIKGLDLMKLQSLNLSNNELTTLESLVGLISLKSLIVSRNRLKGLRQAIGVLVPLKNVKVLDLTGNPVTEDGRYYEEALLTFPLLTILDKVDLSQLITNSSYSTSSSSDKEEGRKIGRIRRVLLSKAYLAFKAAHGHAQYAAAEESEEGSVVSASNTQQLQQQKPKPQAAVKPTTTKQASRYSQQRLDMTDNSIPLSVPPSPSVAVAAINRAASFEHRHLPIPQQQQPPILQQPMSQQQQRQQQVEVQRPPPSAAKTKPVAAAPALHDRLHGAHTTASRMVRRSFAVHRTHMEEHDYRASATAGTAGGKPPAADAASATLSHSASMNRLLEPTAAQKIRRRSFGIASPHDLEDQQQSLSQVFDFNFQEVLDATNNAEEAINRKPAVHKGPRYTTEQIKLMQQEPRYGIYHPRYRQPKPHFGYSKPFIHRTSVDDLGNITAAALLKNSRQLQQTRSRSRSVSPTNNTTTAVSRAISPYLQSIPGFNKIVERIRDGFEKLPVRGTFTRAAKGLPAEWYPMDIQDLEAIRRQGYFHETIGDAAMDGQETRDLALQTLLNDNHNLSAFSTASLAGGGSMLRAVEEVRGSGSVVLSPNKRGRRGSLGSHLSRQYRDQSLSPAATAHFAATTGTSAGSDRSRSPAAAAAATGSAAGKHRGKGNPITRTVWAQPLDTHEFSEVEEQRQQAGGESGFATVEDMHFLHSQRRRSSMSMSGSNNSARNNGDSHNKQTGDEYDEAGSNSSYGGEAYPYNEDYEESEVYMQPPPPHVTKQRQPIKAVSSNSPSSLRNIFPTVGSMEADEEEQDRQQVNESTAMSSARPAGLSVSLQRSFRELSSSFDHQPDYSAFFTSTPQQAAAAVGSYAAAYQSSTRNTSASVFGSSVNGEEESKARPIPAQQQSSQIITRREELKPEASLIINSRDSIDLAVSPALQRGYSQDKNQVVAGSREQLQAEEKESAGRGSGVGAKAAPAGGGEGALSSYLAWLTQQQQLK